MTRRGYLDGSRYPRTRVGGFFKLAVFTQACSMSAMSNTQHTAEQFVSKIASTFDFATATEATIESKTVPAIEAEGAVYAITNIGDPLMVSGDQAAEVTKQVDGVTVGVFSKSVHRSLTFPHRKDFFDNVSHYAVGQNINFSDISPEEMARRRDLTGRLIEVTESIYSEVFWIETREDVYDTLNEGADEPREDFDIYFVADWKHIDQIEKFVSDVESGLREEEEEEYEDEFETSMDRFERLTGANVWCIPMGLNHAVEATVDSYAYAEPSTMTDVTIVDYSGY